MTEKSLSKPSQNERILRHLESHTSITPLEAMNHYGIMRLAARIADMEARGTKFIHQPVTVTNRYGEKIRTMSYSLNQEAQYE